MKDKYEDLVYKFDKQSVYVEQIMSDKSKIEISNKEYEDLINNYQTTIDQNEQQIKQLKNKIEILNENLSKEREVYAKSCESLKTEHENLTDELHQTKQMKDNIQSLLDQTAQERTIYKDKYQQLQQYEHTGKRIYE